MNQEVAEQPCEACQLAAERMTLLQQKQQEVRELRLRLEEALEELRQMEFNS